MAKKIINVVWKVDDQALDQSKQKVQAVAAETKKAEDAMTKASRSAVQTGNQWATNIEGLTIQVQRLASQIRLTNQADTERLNTLKTQYTEAKARLEDYNKALDTTNAKGKAVTSTFLSFKEVITGAFSAIILQQIAAATVSLTKLAGTTQSVDAAFKRTFSNSSVLLQRLRDQTHGTLTDFQLMQKTIEAFHLGVDVQKLPELLAFAATYAQQTGKEMDYVVESIVNGIGRKSLRWLDNLGISTVRVKEELGGVAIASKSVGEVTEAVVKIANERLKQMGGYAETGATKIDQMTVAWIDLKKELGKKLEAGGVIDFIADGFRGMKLLLTGTQEFKEQMAETEAARIVSTKKTKQEVEDEIKRRIEGVQKLEAEIKRIQAALPKEGFITLFTPTETLQKQQQVKDMQDVLSQRKMTVESLQELAKAFKDIKDPGDKVPGIIAAIKDQIENLNEELDLASTPEKIEQINAKTEVLQKRLKALQLVRPLVPGQAEEADAKKFADEQAAFVAQVNQEIADQTEKDFQKSLKVLEANEDAEQKEKDRARQIEYDRYLEGEKIKTEALREQEQQRKVIRDAAVNYGLQSLDRILTATFINRDNDLQNLNDYYDEQLAATGDNEKAKKKIEKERKTAEEQQRIKQLEADAEDARTKIAIDTAVGVIRALITPPVPNFLLASIVAGAGIIQAATVKSVSSKSLRTRAFAEGEVGIEGPGTTTSDSINARLSRGESVINAEATAASRNLLEAINDRRIDDRVLGKLAINGGGKASEIDMNMMTEAFNKALKQNKIDYDVQGYTLMKAERVQSGFVKRIRSKVFSK